MKYRVKKRIEISAAHRLKLNYESKCSDLHGHNWIIEVECGSNILDKNGMVIDFIKIKRIVMRFDHMVLNASPAFADINPTAENIAQWIADEVQTALTVEGNGAMVLSVMVQESEGNIAWYDCR